jgi:hypothetical protein
MLGTMDRMERLELGAPWGPHSSLSNYRFLVRLVSYCFCWFIWSEREDLNLRPLVSQTSALTGLRHAPMPFP